MRTPRKLSLLLIAGVIGCGTAPAPAPPARRVETTANSAAPATANKMDKKTIVIDNFSFDPVETTVSVGAEVTWVNHDDVPHTATSTTKPKVFDSGALDTDQQYSHVFTAAGEYEYFCAVHPHMTGRVIVK